MIWISGQEARVMSFISSYDLIFRTRGPSPESDYVPLWYDCGQCSSWRDHQVMEMLCQGQREGQENCSDQISEGNILPAIQDPLIHCSLTLALLVIHFKWWTMGKRRYGHVYDGLMQEIYCSWNQMRPKWNKSISNDTGLVLFACISWNSHTCTSTVCHWANQISQSFLFERGLLKDRDWECQIAFNVPL